MEATTDNTRTGFTLVEVLAVVIVLGIMASIVTVNVSGHLHRARLISSADRLASLDRSAREAARRRSETGHLHLDAREDEVHFRFRRSTADPETPRPVILGKGVELDDVKIGEGQSAERQIVEVSPTGQSETYALQLRASNGTALWLVTLGLTGQHLRFESEEDARAFLAP